MCDTIRSACLHDIGDTQLHDMESSIIYGQIKLPVKRILDTRNLIYVIKQGILPRSKIVKIIS